MGESSTGLRFRSYGDKGPVVVVLHGGPGAPGYMAPLAHRLAQHFRVLESFQRGSGDQPLSVHQHLSDLAAFIETEAREAPVGIVGHSWGAMLALCFAAAFSERTSAVALVGCGSFDRAARAELEARVKQRVTPELRAELDQLTTRVEDPDERLRLLGDLLLPVYSYSPVATSLGTIECDAAANEQSWSDMLRLQRQGQVPSCFEAISAPVIMLHGAQDPHPGALIRASLVPHLSQLEYREWEKCGHYPWLEAAVRIEFESVLESWLLEKLTT